MTLDRLTRAERKARHKRERARVIEWERARERRVALTAAFIASGAALIVATPSRAPAVILGQSCVRCGRRFAPATGVVTLCALCACGDRLADRAPILTAAHLDPTA